MTLAIQIIAFLLAVAAFVAAVSSEYWISIGCSFVTGTLAFIAAYRLQKRD